MRRYQGRDPLGRDVYGEAGAPSQVPAESVNWASYEQSGTPLAAPVNPIVVVIAQERVAKKAREVEGLRRDVEIRRSERATPAASTESKFSPEPWQLAAAALTIGVTIGRFWGKKKGKKKK